MEFMKMNYNYSYQYNNQSQNKKKVLLIDEVDVFFGKKYFGETYKPILRITGP